MKARNLIAIVSAAIVGLIPSLPLVAAPVSPAHLRVIARRNVPAPGGYTYTIEEDFEGSWPATGWTNAGSPEGAYTTSPAPLEGSQSMRIQMSAAVERSTYDLGASNDISEFTICAIVRIETLATFATFLSTLDASGGGAGNLEFLRQAAPARFVIAHGTSQTTGSATFSLSTTYYLWVEYVAETTPGSSNDGIVNVFISTTTTKPGSPDIAKTNGNGDSIRYFLLGTTASLTAEHFVDHYRVIEGAPGTVTDWPP